MLSYRTIDAGFITITRRYSVCILRYALGVIFLWFGLLKVFGVSPVEQLVASSYPMFPMPIFMAILGVWETIIGLGLICRRNLRIILFLLWLQMLGTFGSFVLSPTLFFTGKNILRLTIEGEFIIKNLVLIAAGLVIAGHEVEHET